MKEKHDQVTNTFQKLLQNTETLADLLEQTMPDLPIDGETKTRCFFSLRPTFAVSRRLEEEQRSHGHRFLPSRTIGRRETISPCVFSFIVTFSSRQDLGGNTLWEDNDTKQFYEDIPDLKLFLPGYAYREPATPAATTSEGFLSSTDRFVFSHRNEIVETETLDSAQMEQEIEKEALEATGTTEAEEEDTTLADIEGKFLRSKGEDRTNVFSDGVEEEVGANNIKLMMDVFVTQLPSCVNREMIDKVRRVSSLGLETNVDFVSRPLETSRRI